MINLKKYIKKIKNNKLLMFNKKMNRLNFNKLYKKKTLKNYKKFKLLKEIN